MIRDSSLNFDNAAAVTVSAPSTNVIDLSAQRDLGTTEPLTISSIVGTTFLGGTSLQVALDGSVDNVTWTTLVTGGVVPVAALVEGTQIANFDLANVDPVGGVPPRYLRLNYVVVGTMTAGTVTSDIVSTKEQFRGYPPGFAYKAPAVQSFMAG
jgi:hypothetical protein